jgi:predicted PurR-regulated permease PerM
VTTIAVILVVTALFTLAVLVTLVWSVVRRTSALAQDLTSLQERLGPDLERLQRDADVTARELEQVSASLERLQQARERRRHGDG